MSTEGKVIKCTAAVAWMPGKDLTLEEVEVDPPKEHEVRIKMMYSGVCHTDWAYLHETQSMSPRPFPLVLGHEGAGVVESVGPGVTKFKPGDTVIPLFLPECGTCRRCKSQETNQCRTNWECTQRGVLADDTSRITCRGQQVHQFLGVCSFSQYGVVLDTHLAKIPEAPLDKVFLLGCGVSTGYGAAINTAKVKPGSSCAVFGLGAVGLSAVMGCAAAGASTIIAVDTNPAKFAKAIELGATECINPKDHPDTPIQDILRERSGGGVDYALECVGNTEVMSQALESTIDAWGLCVIAGWTETEKMSVEVEQLLVGRTLKGTYFGGWKGATDLPKLVEKYLKKELKLDEFITHSFPLKDVNKAFELLKSGQSIRSVISLW